MLHPNTSGDVSISAHLNGLAAGIRTAARVAGLQVIYHRYTGTAARKDGYSYSSGTYMYGLTSPN
jgi:hypothetical protein